jgi:hypothetical protein
MSAGVGPRGSNGREGMCTFYIARELLSALILFTVAFVLLWQLMVGLVVIWEVAKHVGRILSKKLTAFDAQPHQTRKGHIAEVRWS